MTNVHLAFSDSDDRAALLTAFTTRSGAAVPQPESSQDMAYTVVARKVQAQVIGELARRAMGRLSSTVRNAWHWYLQQAAERRTVTALRHLDDHLLRDIGVNRLELDAQVHARLSKPAQPATVVVLDTHRSDDDLQPTDRAA